MMECLGGMVMLHVRERRILLSTPLHHPRRLTSFQLGTQVENGKQHYINDTLSTEPIAQINTLNVVAGCNQMVWQWEFIGIGTGEYRIRGMTLITVDANSSIVEQYVEFNSLAWGANIGFNITPSAIP